MTETTTPVREVLVLDDDPRVLRTLERYLRGPHLHIVTCSEIEAAQCLLDHERFDVLVTDLEVSDLGGLEGIRLIRHAAVHFPDLEVIVFSGKLSRQVRKIGQALKVDHLLEKPSALSELRDLIDQGCSSPPRRNGNGLAGEVTRISTLKDVLSRQEISAVLQPIMCLDPATGAWEGFGAEGLARGPKASPLQNPELLLSYASRKERLFETELECIRAVLGQAKHLDWVRKLFINVRLRTLSDPRFASVVTGLVRDHELEPSDIVLELTEQQSILNLEAFDATLETLRGLGFQLALDDFGSGFANLHLLQRLPLNYLKIDGFFSQNIERDFDKQAIVRSTLDLARELGIQTIMERVESESELEMLSGLGICYAQGYYFSRPAPGAELAQAFHPMPAAPASEPADLPTPATADRSERVQHQISNSLTAIALYADQCLKKIETANPLRQDLQEILSASEQAVSLLVKRSDG